MIALCLLGGVGYFILSKRNNKEKEEKDTAQDFVNVADIKNNVLYTRDGNIMSYFKIQAISIELLSDIEKENLCNMLTAELSSIDRPFKFLAISRPVDISSLLDEYTEILHNTNDHIQKELLRKEIYEMNDYALSGDVVERQFYIQLWQRYYEGAESDLIKNTWEFIKRFENVSIKCELLSDGDIISLCNLVNNGDYENMEECY